MKQYVQTEDNDYIREFSSRGLVNTNRREYESRLAMRRKLKSVTKLEEEMAELKAMLSQIIGKQ